MRWSLPLAIFIALLNPLFTREGLTVVLRLGDAGPLGQLDITLEAIIYGLVLGLRVLVIICAAALFSLCVDPDRLLHIMRRFSFRSALVAVLATRLVPVMVADGRRMAEAQRCRADGGGSKPQLLRAVTAAALDRAIDVAATLEVRGYALTMQRPQRGERRRSRLLASGSRSRSDSPSSSPDPFSRHDIAFLLAAVAITSLAVAGRLLAPAVYYPELGISTGAAGLLLAGPLVVAALLAFLNRRGIEP
jgi:energy-coupling factor transport system permease protein